jgi:hypothetical protein
MKLHFFALFICLSPTLSAQIVLNNSPKKEDFYTSIASYFYQIGENEKALTFFKKAEKAKIKIRSFDYVLAVKAAYALQKQKEIQRYIKRSILSGMEMEDIKEDSLFYFVLQLPVNQHFIKKFSKIRNDYLTSLDADLNTKLQILISVDQLFREKNYGLDSVQKPLQERIFCNIDTQFVFPRLLELLKKPDIYEKNIGQQRLMVLFRHQSYYPGKFEILQPYILKLIEKKVIEAGSYASIYDSYYATKTKGNPFATQFSGQMSSIDDNDKPYIRRIENIKIIDDYRISLGLLPLNLTYLNTRFPEDYKPKFQNMDDFLQFLEKK